MTVSLTDEQRAAVEQRDSGLFVHANAGSGKTRVLVERFARAVLEDGVPVERILAITFTEKAAAELKAKIRRRLLEDGGHELARQAEGAWISTIHGFCSKLLRRHALAAGIDPEYRVLDESQAARLAIDAFDRALEAFLQEGDPRRLDLAAAHNPDRLRRMVTTVHAKRRSAGEESPELPPIDEPPVGEERERLAAAAGAALRELGAHDPKPSVRRVMDKLQGCSEALDELGPDAVGDPVAFGKFEFSPGKVRALQGQATAEACAALSAWVAACEARRAWGDYMLLRELLRGYTHCYATAKERRSALDFEDLELGACALLEQNGPLRERYGQRFVHILVDEFQDTNRLQIRLLRLLSAGGRLFTVGDEFQSIYGFRHADVSVFRELRDAAAAQGRVRALSANFRSRPEILTALNEAFAPHWQGDFRPLEPGGAAESVREAGQLALDLNGSTPAAARAAAVEVLAVDQSEEWKPLGDTPFGQSLAGVPSWRAAEMRLLAERVRELVRGEGRPPGDIVVLTRAAVDLRLYERALRERGIDTYVVGGRSYWGQQQVADLRAYLAVLANPLDEQALYSVLGSPLGGLSLDALAVLGLEARGRKHAWWILTEAFVPKPSGGGAEDEGFAARLGGDDRRRARELVERVGEHRRAAERLPLERLLDRVITDTGYDRALLALPDGRRRMANVRKLMRLARAFEADAGGGLRAFLDHLAEQDLLAAREGEAPLEAEDLDAVRLMTIHAAKGLEFPVVCVADLGRRGRGDDDALRVTDDGRVGLRIASLGGGSAKGLALAELQEEQDRLQDEEERRIFYVAMTRAQELLVLSGATDMRRWPEEQPLGVPMNWIWRGMAPALPDAAERPAGAPDPASGARCTVLRPDNLDSLLAPEARYGEAALEIGGPPPAAPLREFDRFEAAPALPVSRLSYSGLTRFRACGYRFYLEKVVGLRELDPQAPGGEPQPEPPGSDELSPLLRGTVVHELLERLDFAAPRPFTTDEIGERLRGHGAEPDTEAVSDVARLVDGFLDTGLFARVAAARRVRKELAFAYELAPPGAGGRSLLVNGFIDVYAEENDGVLIVDYKTDSLEASEPTLLCDEQYAVQRLIYALAALRGGAASVEVAYCFLERPGEPVTRAWEGGQADALERELVELATGVVGGRFDPAAAPHRDLCLRCGGRPGLCSWEESATLRTRGAPA